MIQYKIELANLCSKVLEGSGAYRGLTNTLVLTWSPGGIIREIIEVPLPLAACRDLINFLTFHISTFLSDEFSSAILTNFIYFSDCICNKRTGNDDTDL